MTEPVNEIDDSAHSENKDEANEGLSLERLSQIIRALKNVKEMAMAYDHHMDRSLKFVTAIDAAAEPYRQLLITVNHSLMK
jgi:hypothetical protein